MALLDTVADYLAEARTMLQDTAVIQRYSDADLKSALGFAIYEARRIRPDLFVGSFSSIPAITSATSTGTSVSVDVQYRLPLVYFMVSHVTLRDEEESARAESNGFRQLFVSKLLSAAA